MTSFGFSVIVTCLLLSIVHGNHKPQCDSHNYGQPRPASCTELILDEIANDRISRLFSLNTYTRPEGITINQFRRRIELPFLRENGRGWSYFKACRHLLIIILDGCKIAFLAVRFLNGSISYDTSIWADIRNEAQRLKRSCGAFATAPLGGNMVVGDHSRLAMILYAPDSFYDEVVKSHLAAGKVLVAEEDDEPDLSATTRIVEPNSLSCRGARLVLNNSTFCNIREEAVNVS